MDYLFRLDNENNVTVTKWDGDYILQEYHLTKKKSWRCNCPVGRYKSCKHLDMFRKELPLQSALSVV